MIRLSLAAVPRRGSLLAAKAGVLAGLILVAGTVAVAGSLLAARLLLPGTLPLAGPGTARAAAGSVLYLALVALLSLGAAAAIREPAAAIGAVLGLLYLFPLAAAVVTDPSWQRHLRQAGPMTAGLAVQATTGLRGLPVGPWAGLGVLAGWAAVLLAAGAAALRWRDA
jgi:ABC-2 type transport system permease protein